jgi:hypothetical protein
MKTSAKVILIGFAVFQIFLFQNFGYRVGRGESPTYPISDQLIWIMPPPFAYPTADPESAYFPDLDANPRNRVRDDFVEQVTNIENWRPLLATGRPLVLDLYATLLTNGTFKDEHGQHYPNKPISDIELRNLITFVRENGIQVSLTGGGLRLKESDRLAPDTLSSCPAPQPAECLGAGRRQAELEYKAFISRWVKNDGPIHYIAADQAIYKATKAIADPTMEITYNLASPSTTISLDHISREILRYFTHMEKQIRDDNSSNPPLRFVTIFGPTQFNVLTPSGFYPSRVDAGNLLANKYVTHLVAAYLRQITFVNSENAGMTIRPFSSANLRFSFDAGPQTLIGDGTYENWSFDRVVVTEHILRSAGFQAALVVHPGSPSIEHIYDSHDVICHAPLNCDRSGAAVITAANKMTFENQIRSLEGYFEAGAHPNTLIVQGWQRYPTKIGPATELYSYFHTLHTALGIFLRQSQPKILSQSMGNAIDFPAQLDMDLNLWSGDHQMAWKAPTRRWDFLRATTGSYQTTNFEMVPNRSNFGFRVGVRLLGNPAALSGFAAIHLGKTNPSAKAWSEGYSVLLRTNGSVAIKDPSTTHEVLPPKSFGLNQVFTMDIRAINGSLSVFFDGEKIYEVTGVSQADLTKLLSIDSFQQKVQFSDPVVFYYL